MPGKETREDISGWGKNGMWDSSEMEASERQMLESGQIRFASQLPLDELGDRGSIRDLPESLSFYLSQGRNKTDLLGLCCENYVGPHV